MCKYTFVHNLDIYVIFTYGFKISNKRKFGEYLPIAIYITQYKNLCYF